MFYACLPGDAVKGGIRWVVLFFGIYICPDETP